MKDSPRLQHAARTSWSRPIISTLSTRATERDTRSAFTRYNDLYVREVAGGRETRLTFDGSDLILNGYASWVYYEEIFGRASRYKAFWWSPDGSHLAFYRFDNSGVH